MLSLHPAKIITTGEGGAVLTDRDDLADALRRFRNHGIATELRPAGTGPTRWSSSATTTGSRTSVRRSGSRQLERLEAFLARRRRLAARYLDGLAGHWAVDVPDVEPRRGPGLALLRSSSSGWIACGSTAAQVFHALRAEGIGVNVHYIPVHHHPYYRAHHPSRTGHSRSPRRPTSGSSRCRLHAGMADADVDDVVAALDKVTTAYRAPGAPS